ncbi:hypothetical protein pipiens_012049 [Culex pipiens pipiens]|uniref:Uncharacterized protein n=1 Tax=Culex pipiens pipiens TaxID=38569 RepID=A0ABD1D3Y3_CULPP
MAVVLLDLPSVACRILEQMVTDELIHKDDKPVIRIALRLRRQQALPRPRSTLQGEQWDNSTRRNVRFDSQDQPVNP